MQRPKLQIKKKYFLYTSILDKAFTHWILEFKHLRVSGRDEISRKQKKFQKPSRLDSSVEFGSRYSKIQYQVKQ